MGKYRKKLRYKLCTIGLSLLIPLLAITPAFAVDETAPYGIIVDGTTFQSNENASGSGWTYSATQGSLSLSNYTGGTIQSSGDLSITSSGTVTITGSDSFGIGCYGDLFVFCLVGTLTVTGGAAEDNYHGNPAIYCTGEADIYTIEHTEVTLTGGLCDQSGYYGGDALLADTARIRGEGKFYMTGGESSAPSKYGGYAINAKSVYLLADCELYGGSGTSDSPAVLAKEYCVIGCINAFTAASGSGCSAFSGVSSISIRYVTVEKTDDYSQWTVTPKKLTLTLNGLGGTINGQKNDCGALNLRR